MLMRKSGQSGSVFTVLLAGIGLTAALSLTTYSIFTGPVSSISRITQKAMADTQMLAISKIAIMDAANQAAAGDCDADGFIEPRTWRTTTGNKPTNGGLVPLTMGAPITDPWKSDYGYCVWDVGPLSAQAGCGGAGVRLDGADNPVLGDAKSQTVMAVISSGQDRIFQTTCNAYVDGTTDVITTSGDDIVMRFSYQEAASATSSLWSLKSGDPDVAEIDKDLEVGDDIAFDQAAGLIQATAVNATGKIIAGGGVTLGDETDVTTCDDAQIGLVRYNSTLPGLEVCAGTTDGWQAAGSGGGGAGLETTTPNIVITPGQQTGMNVDGSCGNATCYGTNVAFTVENYGQQDTDPLAATLSNLTNFEFVSNTCTGVVLQQNDTCMITIRPKATGNTSYTGTLTVTSNNAPIAILSGTSTNFGCVMGRTAPGGIYAGCNVGSGYDFIVTPGGCSGTTTNPVCPGTSDTYRLPTMTNYTYFRSLESEIEVSDSYQATVNAVAYSYSGGSFPAAEYCYNLVYGGKDDWYLPSEAEIDSYIYPNKATLGGFVNSDYALLNVSGTTNMVHYYRMDVGNDGVNSDAPRYLRCARREPSATPTPPLDNGPVSFAFTPSLGGVANETRTSNTITIAGITVPITFSVSGGISPLISKNGGAFEAGPVTVSKGDTITLRATSPAAGIESSVSVTAGSGGATWKVRTASSKSVRIFSTNGTFNGSQVSAATCNAVAAAASMGGSWVPVVGQSQDVSLHEHLPWDWSTMYNTNNQVVATSLSDYLDGTISASIAYNEYGVAVSGTAYAGASSAGVGNDRNCLNWTDGSNGTSGYYLNVISMTGGEYLGSTNWASCTAARRIVCMESSPATDTNPTDVFFNTLYTTASTQVTSNTVTVSGVNTAIDVSVSAGGEFRKNGGAWTSVATTANNGDQIQLRATSGLAGTETVIILALGSDNPTWKVRVRENNTAYAFVTSTQSNANVGGQGGAHARCQAAADNAGIGGTWKAMMAIAGASIRETIPWNWTTLKNMNGDNVVTNGIDDLLDGSIINPINRTEGNAIRNSFVHTQAFANGEVFGANGFIYDCGSGTATSGAGGVGDSGSTTGSFLFGAPGGSGCANIYPLYCINDPDGAPMNIAGTSAGYLVMTSASWDGNLGGKAGADAKCLADLTANDWMGKSTASAAGMLNSTYVKSFVCTNSCNGNLLPLTRYYFALSGDATKGGASFVSNADSRGPGDNISWALSSYFGNSYEHWSNRATNTGASFINGPQSLLGPNHCNFWTSNSSSETGNRGNTNSTTNIRWNDTTAGAADTCDKLKRIMCVVNPP